MLIAASVAGGAVGNIKYSFFVMLPDHLAFRMLMTAITGKGAVFVIPVTCNARYIVVIVKLEISGMVEGRWYPLICCMALIAVFFQQRRDS